VKTITRSQVDLRIRAELVFLPVATAFAEESSRAFGLHETGALSLTLATEEIFSYLCHSMEPAQDIHIRSVGGGYYVALSFRFKTVDLDLRAFNLNASVSFRDEAGIRETGLLIASRMVDRFRFSRSGEVMELTVVQEKTYPLISDQSFPRSRPMTDYTVRLPDQEELKVFVRAVGDCYGSSIVPDFLDFPGKVVDMIACGEYQAAIAVDDAGTIGGGIIWRSESLKMMECYGPYLFHQPSASHMAEGLVDYCIGTMAKTGAVGLMNRYPTPELPSEYFEELGTITFDRHDGSLSEVKAFYRHLKEDLGTTVWSHPTLDPFLVAHYERLAFAREIRHVADSGEKTSRYSVVSAEFDRTRGSVTLRPVWWGEDASETLAEYREILSKEGIISIFFEMDLGDPWNVYFAPALKEHGFEPRLLLPYARTKDLVVFQHEIGASRS
jgi:hypothetical protein